MAEKEHGKFIPLATKLEPNAKNKALNEKVCQNKLFESWTKNLEVAKEKTFVLGSEVNEILIKDKWSHISSTLRSLSTPAMVILDSLEHL